MSAYKLCVPSPANAAKVIESVSAQNEAALEMKEHYNCLVGEGHFYEGGVVVDTQGAALFHRGACLHIPEAEACIDALLEDSPTTVFQLSLRPYLLGIVERCGQKHLPAFCLAALGDPVAAPHLGEKLKQLPLLVYSSKAIIANLQTADGMSEEEALEFYEFNIAGSWVGPGTPLFL